MKCQCPVLPPYTGEQGKMCLIKNVYTVSGICGDWAQSMPLCQSQGLSIKFRVL